MANSSVTRDGAKPECQFGKRCYRKNPIHFKEYSHPILEAIILKGKDSNNEYDIPDDILQPRDDTKQQLHMIEKILNIPPVVVTGSTTKPTPKAIPSTSPGKPSTSTSKASSSTRKPSTTTSKPSSIRTLFASPKPTTSRPIETVVLDSDDDDDTQEAPPKRTKLSVSPKPTGRTVNDKLMPPTKKNGKFDAQPGPSSSSSSPVPRKPPPTAGPSTSRTDARNKLAEKAAGERKVVLVANDLSKSDRKIEDYIEVLYPKGVAIKKYEASGPYNFFLTAVTKSKETHKEGLSITLQEILDTSLGDLETSVQINFMIDVGWLLAHYYFAGHDRKPLLILYGDQTPELAQITKVRPNVTAIHIQMPTPFSTHHTKVMLLGYTDKSMRVIVSTANLLDDDWQNRTQGIWISPRCYEMDTVMNAAAGESVTGFRADLIRYLNAYKLTQLQEWTARIQRTNFEAVKVFLVCSVPGSHQTMGNDPKFGHLRMAHLLSKHVTPIDEACPLIAQSSSIGSLGKSVGLWITEISSSFCRDSGPPRLQQKPAFKMIYPSFADVMAGHDGIMSGGCLPYGKKVHTQQTWLEGHMQRWRSDRRLRTKATPHIKTYCRYSETKGLYWFCLTSANLSRAAWGSLNKSSNLGQVIRCSNFEVGVLFLPKFISNSATFPLNEYQETATTKLFPMPYDLPLVPYTTEDAPFLQDYLIEMMG